jgi:hypothetical protein
MRLFFPTSCLVAAAFAGSATAATIDGQLEAAYGPALFVQDTPTGFGDNTDPDPQFAGGSEIDGVYAYVDGTNLNVLATGNLETNFNRLILFIDSVSGGQNVIDGSTTDTSSGGGALNDYNGLTFDTGIAADYYVQYNGGNNPIEFFADFAEIGGTGSFIGGSTAGSTLINGSNGVVINVDNSNILGVTDVATAGAAAVTTGVEFEIPLAVIGNPTGDINVVGFVAGGGFLSNQVFGGVAGAGNLGNAPDLSQIAGDQFVTVAIPEPASLALVGLGGLAMLGRRRG